MKRKVYIIQPSFRKMDGKIVKGGFVGNKSVDLPILSATVPKHWEKECCYEYLDEVDYYSDASIVFVIGTSNDMIHGYSIAKKFKEKGKVIIYGGYQDTFSLKLMKEASDSIYHGVPGPKQMETILEDAYSGDLKQNYHCGINIDFSFDYSIFHGKKVRHIQVVSSLGCIFKCDYCCHQVSYDGVCHLRNLDNVMTDLRAVRQFTKYVGFRDPNIYNNRKHLVELCNRLIKEKLKIRWGAQCPVYVGNDSDVLTLMRKAGCRILFFGLETLNQKNLEGMHKPFKAEKYRELISKVQKTGIFTAGYFMFGLDNDTKETFDEVFSFIRRSKLSLPLITLYIPMPGTRLFQRMKSEGRLDYPDLKTFLKNPPLYGIPCNQTLFTPKNISRENLEKGFMELSRKITTNKEIFRRVFKPNSNLLQLMSLNLDLRNERIRMEAKT